MDKCLTVEREIPGPAGRVLDAAGSCLARVGLAKTTLDDVAREARCARATVYRYFPGKQQLLAAYTRREIAAFQRRLLAATAGTTSLADTIVAAVTTAAEALTTHPALRFIAGNEPEVLLPFLAFERESALLGEAATLAVPAFDPYLPTDSATRLAEWVARITLSYLCCPSEHVDLTDDTRVRALVDDFVLPGFRRSASTFEGVTP
jgi:AcrR family transcriptional regulator